MFADCQPAKQVADLRRGVENLQRMLGGGRAVVRERDETRAPRVQLAAIKWDACLLYYLVHSTQYRVVAGRSVCQACPATQCVQAKICPCFQPSSSWFRVPTDLGR